MEDNGISHVPQAISLPHTVVDPIEVRLATSMLNSRSTDAFDLRRASSAEDIDAVVQFLGNWPELTDLTLTGMSAFP